MSELKTIKVYPDTKESIDKFKTKGKSYDDVLMSFIDYFETTKIHPNRTDLSPSSVTKKSTERVIKILKNIENKKLSKMLIMLDEIYLKVSKNEGDNSSTFSEKVVRELVEKNEILEAEKAAQIREVNRLKLELSKTENAHNNSTNLSFLKAIENAAIQLNENVKSSLGRKDEYIINKNIFKRNIDTIMNLIRDVK